MDAIREDTHSFINPFVNMLFPFDHPHYNPLYILSEALSAVDLADQPGQIAEIPLDEDAGELNPFLLAAALEADAENGPPAPAAAAAVGQPMHEGAPSHGLDLGEPGRPGDEGLDAMIACLRNPGEGHPALNANPEGLPPNAVTLPVFLQDSRYSMT